MPFVNAVALVPEPAAKLRPFRVLVPEVGLELVGAMLKPWITTPAPPELALVTLITCAVFAVLDEYVWLTVPEVWAYPVTPDNAPLLTDKLLMVFVVVAAMVPLVERPAVVTAK